jgi:hypothetical protein
MNYQQPYHDPNQQAPDSKQEKVNTMWKIFSLVYVLAALGLVFYWEIQDEGLAIMVREWQGYLIDDGYYPALDVLLSLLILLIPMFVAKIVIEKATGVKIEGYRK